MRTIKFSVSDEEYAIFYGEAGERGLTLSAYCKQATFSYLTKYPSKRILAKLKAQAAFAGATDSTPRFVGSRANCKGATE